MIKIYYETLNGKLKKQIVNRELSVNQVESVFNKIKNDYQTRNKAIFRVIIIVFVLTVFMFGTTIKAKGADGGIILVLASTLIITIALLVGVYFLTVRLVPIQFCNALKKGYPELVDTYGMDAIKSK